MSPPAAASPAAASSPAAADAAATATVKVCYFAHARSATGCEEEALALPAATDAAAILAALGARHPRLGAILPSCRLAHNLAFARGPVQLADGDELAVIPPVSGG